MLKSVQKMTFFVRKALIFGVVGAIFIFGLYFLLKEEKFIDRPKTGKNIIVFGDSLVEGIGSSQNNNFVSLLSDRLGLNIINAGKSGDTTGSALARLETDVLMKNPRVVIVLLGGNDALRRISPEETFNNLALIIDQIHSRGAGVILLGVRGGLFKDKYEDEFIRLVKEKKVSFVPDVLEGIFGHPEFMYDAIHPNDAGHRLIADKVEPALRAVVGDL
ncbi:arylesterase [Candidatus Parcubacteria bacterium]|nr:MAG: arylesterase [Candidatus Parcubacteria bacterium]